MLFRWAVHTEPIEGMKITHKFSLKIHENKDVQCKITTSNKEFLKDRYKSFSNDLIKIINLLCFKEFHFETRNIYECKHKCVHGISISLKSI